MWCIVPIVMPFVVGTADSTPLLWFRSWVSSQAGATLHQFAGKFEVNLI
jgi:hypothetical protein